MAFAIRLNKPTADTKLGLRLRTVGGVIKLEKPGAQGLAKGLLIDDAIESINGVKPRDHNDAADVLKAATGDIVLRLRRHQSFYPADEQLHEWNETTLRSLPFPQRHEFEGLHVHPVTGENVALNFRYGGVLCMSFDPSPIAKLPRKLPDALASKGIRPEAWARWRTNLNAIDSQITFARGWGCILTPLTIVCSPFLVPLAIGLLIATCGLLCYCIKENHRATRISYLANVKAWQENINMELQAAGITTVFVKTRSLLCHNTTYCYTEHNQPNTTYEYHSALVDYSFICFALCDDEVARLRSDPHIGPAAVNVAPVAAALKGILPKGDLLCDWDLPKKFWEEQDALAKIVVCMPSDRVGGKHSAAGGGWARGWVCLGPWAENTRKGVDNTVGGVPHAHDREWYRRFRMTHVAGAPTWHGGYDPRIDQDSC